VGLNLQASSPEEQEVVNYLLRASYFFFSSTRNTALQHEELTHGLRPTTRRNCKIWFHQHIQVGRKCSSVGIL